MNDAIQEILYTEEQLEEIIVRLAKEVDRDYNHPNKKLVLLCILKGSVAFTAELMKRLETPCEVEFMKVSSYGNNTVSSGSVNIILDLARDDLESCDLLIVEDILDTGRTLHYLVNYLRTKGARSVRTCTMLNKPSRRTVDFDADYVGTDIEDLFVVGYGLDYAERYRDLPYVGVLKPEVYGG